MKNVVILILVFLLHLSSKAQTISQFVISPAGAYAETGQYSLSYSLTQTAIQSITTSNAILTEGFQQPEDFFTGLTEIKINNDLILSLYPNPSEEYIHVRIKGRETEFFTIQIFNTLGASVTNPVLVSGNTDNSINVSSCPAGTYMVRVTSGQFTHIAKFLKTGL